MGKALGQLWLAFQTLFGAFNVLAMAINHLCVWGERTAKSFAEEAEEDRLIKAAERAELLGMGLAEKAGQALAIAAPVARKAKATASKEE